MERVGISRHIASIGDNCLSGGVVFRRPVSLSTILIDRVPRVCLRAIGPKLRRKLKAAPIQAVTGDSSSCVQVMVADEGEQKTRRSRRLRSVGDAAAPRRKRKSTAAASAAVTDAATAPQSELERLAKSLESAYHKDATTLEEDYLSVLKELEAQTRSIAVGELGDGEATVSCSSPTMSSVRKRRGKPPPNIALEVPMHLDHPTVICPQTTKDGFIVRSVPPVIVRRRVGEGKCRLNLVSRIALRKRRKDRSMQVQEAGEDRVNGAQYIWSDEAHKLIDKHGTALELGAVDWDSLKRGLLSAEEESELANLMKPMKNFLKVRKTLSEALGKEPSDEQWAAAAQLDAHTFRRHLLLGRAARNKLIQHNLRLVLSQAHKYHNEKSSLSLFDLCQEGVSGLIQGVDKFDPKRGHRFSTYAVYWVRNSILRAQTRSGNSVRSPYNVAMHKLNIRKAKLDLLVELERAPTDDEVRNHLGLATERFRDIVRSGVPTRSMHSRSPITGEELIETMADTSDDHAVISSTGDDASIRFGVEDVLGSLKPKEGLVLRQRFGLDGKGERTLGEIGQDLGLSREMVRKYEACALMKMKHPTRMDYLRTYLSTYQG